MLDASISRNVIGVEGNLERQRVPTPGPMQVKVQYQVFRYIKGSYFVDTVGL